MLKKVKIFTDGSCLGNPGPGGYGVILCYKLYTKILNNGFYLTTNNRMELMGVIVGLESLKQSCVATIITDSKYIQQGITLWIHEWKKRKWKTTKNKSVKNIDLWLRLELVTKKHIIKWHWIKGHSCHIYNEKCDKIARLSAQKPSTKDM